MPAKVDPIIRYVGVRKNKNRWQAYHGRQRFGTFDTAYEAACARARALNEPLPPPPAEPEVSFVDDSIDRWWFGLFQSGQTWQIGVVSKAELKKKYDFATLNVKLAARTFFEKLADLIGRQPAEVSLRESRRVEWCWVLDVDDCPSSLKDDWLACWQKKKAADRATRHRELMKEKTREYYRVRGEEYESDEDDSEDHNRVRARQYSSDEDETDDDETDDEEYDTKEKWVEGTEERETCWHTILSTDTIESLHPSTPHRL